MMGKENIRDSFQKVKEDIWYLSQEIERLHQKIDKITGKNGKNTKNGKNENSTETAQNQTFPAHTSTHHYGFKGLKQQYLPISTGNDGASTDKQTNRHINTHPPISYAKTEICPKKQENAVDLAADILDSLDNLKKDIRRKFKRLTNQELLVFTTIYQLEEEQVRVDYSLVAETLGLSSSSIRDYVGRLIKKGIPVDKKRIKNKQIQLSISENLKKIASLPTILELRDL